MEHFKSNVFVVGPVHQSQGMTFQGQANLTFKNDASGFKVGIAEEVDSNDTSSH